MIIPVRHSLHKFIQQVIIGLASNSLMSQPNVERVLQQRLQKHTDVRGENMKLTGRLKEKQKKRRGRF